MRVHFQNILNKYQEYHTLYTDEPKTEVGVNSAVFINNKLHTWLLSNLCGIYTAEVYTLW